MKITLRPIVSVLAIASLIIITSCGGSKDPAPSIEDQQLEKLTATWLTSNVTLDQVDKTSDYETPGFQLTISGTPTASSFGYSAGPLPANRPSNSPWPISGSWAFGTSPESQITRDKGTPNELPLTYSLSSDGKTLQISFTYSGIGVPAAGRQTNVKGAWVFTFTKA